MNKAPETIEFLYGVDSSVNDDSRFYEPPRVVQFRITRKTARRIYYLRRAGWPERYVDRQTIERDGEIRRRSAGWWEPDGTLYLTSPELPDYTSRPDIGELKAAMAAAHPDRGGTDAAFIAARTRFERAARRTA
ncbi:hypothetical protein OG875_05200 [Streptomyces sp. NBC_01498]|uniref:hypothetical protein n=1 Tax=Streptomyces sp. NBC_01498 TaxID=2975870 RepID=UPI002E7B5EB6|nr:hypothetical protein [Streptomyces sp. NBC_01498]WTL24055.1 hypothetical protein OG875_05200 [Streptomyces sp. NBC_01498]